jgi:cell division transport system permease protein
MNILRYALKNIFRNFFLSASSILIIWLLVFFFNILLFVLYATGEFITTINDRIAITINFRDTITATDPRALAFQDGMRSSFTGITVEYISETAALQILSARNPDLAKLIEKWDENPLPNSLRVSSIDLDSYDALNTYIERYQDILQYEKSVLSKKLIDYKTQYERIRVVVKLLQSLEYWVYVLLALFIFTIFIVMHMIIRNFMFFLQDEVRIIELVWGRPSFIYGPFMIQGFFYTGVATIIALSVFALGEGVLSLDTLSESMSTLYHGFYEHLWLWWRYELLGFSFIGMLSALIASQSYINSTIGK